MRTTSPRPVWPTVIVALSSAFVVDLPAQDAPPRSVAKPFAIKVGTIHPVSGPEIENGVIVVRRGLIRAIGPADKVRIPRTAEVIEYPEGHAYPGLVDALSTAFSPSADRNNAGVNAGTKFFDALDRTDEPSRKLVRYGITTAYVSNRSTATWRGIGAIVRPNNGGFATIPGKRDGGLGLRMTTGPKAGHALDRLKRFDKTGNVFDSLEAYEKKQKEYQKALTEYKKKYEAYLDYHRKAAKTKKPAAAKKPDATVRSPAKAPVKAPAKDAAEKGNAKGNTGKKTEKPAKTGTERPNRRRTGRRGGFGGRRTGRGPGGTGAGETGASRTGGKADASGPKKPKWPARVRKDKAKEALLAVINGKLPLRVEAHRKDEIRAALFMALAKELPGITIEYASSAGDIGKEIAESGAPVVLSGLLPGGRADYDKDRDGSLPGKLHAAGVEVAIGSGSLANARNLTLMAAYACGRGMPEAAAVRAVTLTPAKILGIADRVGSLERGKIADVLITSGPLLHSDTRVLRVFAQGQSQYKSAKPDK